MSVAVVVAVLFFLLVFFKQKTAYEMRISDWSSDVCSSDLIRAMAFVVDRRHRQYAGALDHDSVVALILQGRGDRGPCLQYLENTVHHLRALGLKDVALERLLTEAQRLTGKGGRQ